MPYRFVLCCCFKLLHQHTALRLLAARLPTFVSISTHRTPAIGRNAPTDTSHAVRAAKASRDVGLVRDPCPERPKTNVCGLVHCTKAWPKHAKVQFPSKRCSCSFIPPFIRKKRCRNTHYWQHKKRRNVPSESWNPSSTSSDRYQSLLYPVELASLKWWKMASDATVELIERLNFIKGL